MRYDEIIASSHDEAYSIVRKKFGDNATVITTREIPAKGFLSMFKKKQIKMTVSISDDDYLKHYKNRLGIPDSARKQLVEQKVESNKHETPVQVPDPMQLMMEKLNTLEQKLDMGRDSDERGESHKNLDELRFIMTENEFAEPFVNEMINRIRETLPVSKIEDRIELQKYAYQYLRKKVSNIIGNDDILYENKKNVMILIGPTGVGKTTTIAKVAANAHINEQKEVDLVTIDGFRIGAKLQLNIYADYMRMKFHFAEDNLQVEKVVTLSPSDLILIDTIGRSQQDGVRLAEMRAMLKVKNIRPHFVLAISATTKPKDVKAIFKNFSIFDYEQIIITKNDESESFGSIISCAIEHKKKIMFCTIGQKVPNDIEKASTDGIMRRIQGFDQAVYLTNFDF